jgi:hypothetical protein
MRRALLLLAACKSPAPAVVYEDAYVDLDAPAHAGPGPGGGLLDELRFAVVGDTRPANLDDTGNYPTAVVTQIWSDVEAESPHPPFTVTTGDYMFASTGGTQVDPQLDLYLGARGNYTGLVYPAMGNHECNGYTQSNCGVPGGDGQPPNYSRFMTRMINPLGEIQPFYIERFAATDGSWSAKLVFIAANSWSNVQAQWLELVLSEPTTYTFAIRHEPPESTSAPGVGPSTLTLAKYPLTLLITGHVHTYQHLTDVREIIVGNGGAPLENAVNYGYVIIARQADGNLLVTEYDYASHAVFDQFMVMPDGLVPPP